MSEQSEVAEAAPEAPDAGSPVPVIPALRTMTIVTDGTSFRVSHSGMGMLELREIARRLLESAELSIRQAPPLA